MTEASAGARLSGDLGDFSLLARVARLGRRWYTPTEGWDRGRGVIGQPHSTQIHTKSGGGLDGACRRKSLSSTSPCGSLLAFSPMAYTHKWLGCVLAPPSRERREGDFGQSQGPMNARTLAGGRTWCVCTVLCMLLSLLHTHTHTMAEYSVFYPGVYASA